MEIEYSLPENILTNAELGELFPDWNYLEFEQKVGIKQRHVVSQDETALDLAEKASLKLFGKIDKEQIDFVLLCTQSPDYFLPTSACILQDRLELSKNCGALDFNLGCSGYVYGLSLAKGLLLSNSATNILFVVADTYSKHINPKDKINRAIFGDAAAATLINKDSFDIGQFVLGTDGKGFKELIIKNGGSRNKITEPATEYEYSSGNITTDNNLYMNGPAVFNFTIKTIPQLVTDTLEKNNMVLDDVDFFIFHQANKYMLGYLRDKIKIDPAKFCIDMENTGNTVSSTIPIALKNAYLNKKIKTGNKVMLVGFGVGLSWGATIINI
ncbi:MAG: ketoacyl-ACP synthase III [Bacteroidota bacterium]